MLNVVTIICFVLMLLMFVWVLKASHNICGAIQAILDIQHSRDKIEELACRRIVELQVDKGKLIDAIEELQRQREEMKCCHNCGHFNDNCFDTIPRSEKHEVFINGVKHICENKSEWELAK